METRLNIIGASIKPVANFNTHLAVASVASGMLATLSLSIDGVYIYDVLAYFAVGVMGGILPDIDSDNSAALRIIFNLFAIAGSISLLVVYGHRYSIAELWGMCLLAFFLVRFGLLPVFKKLTVHRGVFHSLVAAFGFWFSTTAMCYYLGDLSSLQSWLVGFFLFFGYLVHLTLDEICSVDLMNRRIKRSFGTALKIASVKNIKTSLAVTGLTVALFYITPPIGQFSELFLDEKTYQLILSDFWPESFIKLKL